MLRSLSAKHFSGLERLGIHCSETIVGRPTAGLRRSDVLTLGVSHLVRETFSWAKHADR